MTASRSVCVFECVCVLCVLVLLLLLFFFFFNVLFCIKQLLKDDGVEVSVTRRSLLTL